MGVTMQVGSDRFPGTIIQVTQNGRRIVFQEDEAIRLDKNGMSESQNYTYRPCATCTMYIATLRKDGKYRLTGGKVPVYIGYRDRYYDYSF
jgi:hypothetical protein